MDFIRNVQVAWHVHTKKQIVEDSLQVGVRALFYINDPNVGVSVARKFKDLGYTVDVKYANQGHEDLWQSESLAIEVKQKV